MIVYTAIFGDIDRLWSANTNGVKHIAFVDSQKEECDLISGRPTNFPVWEQRVIIPNWDNRRTARHFKTMPHLYMPDADTWIWVDCNVRLMDTPQNIVDKYLQSGFATFKHPDRDCVYDEAEICARVNKDKPEILGPQVARYYKEGMPKHWGLAETRVVLRTNNEINNTLDSMWWDEIRTHSLRDQVSLPYVFWKMGLKWSIIPGRCGPIHPVGPFKYMRHNGRN